MEADTKGKQWSILDARIIGSLYFLTFFAFPTFLKQLHPKKINKISFTFFFKETLAWKYNTEEVMIDDLVRR